MSTVEYKKKNKIKGYHGTYPKHKDSILNNNYYESPNVGIWVGEGVYFFVEGISSSSPLECAITWAKDQVLTGKVVDNHTHAIALETEIGINKDKYLDLTVNDGLVLFNEFRQQVVKNIEESGKQIKGKYKDTDVLTIMKEALKIEYIKANVYIQLGILRTENMLSRLPNVTIFAVNNPRKNINKHSIKEVLRREIK